MTNSALFPLLIAASLFALGGCSSNIMSDEIVAMEAEVAQLQNLNDYDSDGVIKARERCDNTVLGAQIDNYGCGEKAEFVKPIRIDIKFAHDSYEIPAEAYGEIKKLADFLTQNEKLTVTIEGHTSAVGGHQYNQKLSKQRAEAVAMVLVNDFNVPQSRVSSIGYGFDRLIESGDFEAAHAINRRTIADLSNVEYVDKMKWHIYTVELSQ